MFAFLKRTFLVILGFLLIALFIWYAGPYFAFGDYRPLESEFARLIAIALVVGFWFLSALIRKLRAFRASDQLLAAVVARPKAEPARPSAEAAKLRERFDEAVTALKQQRRSGHSLYDLPWYVIIGAPGSGKTTALMNSGLTFPLEQRVGKGALRGVGGTRNCDWWFTDEAIFLDTAGRYTTQDSDANSDAAGWAEFLALLRTYRARRPINGVILTLNAQDLMVQGDQAREVHVEAARRRLTELNRELGIQLPVYLFVTKVDLVAGFTEYFDDLTPDGRRQVWGVTFPYEQTLSNEAAQVFPEEFDALMARLNERVLTRVEEVRDVRRRTRIFAFPQQLAAMRDALTQFVSEVFAATRFDQQILLRGVYFTSGTQDGTPIDRLLAGIGRRFGVAPDVIAPASGAGKAYFVERLLKDVLISESGLAGINRRLEARKAAAQLGAYAAIAAIAVLGVLLWTISYNRNRGYLEQAAADVDALRKLPPAPPTAPLDNLRPRLDALSALVASAERYRETTPLTMRWGLYQGRAIGNAARDAYVRELDGTLLPRVAARIQSRLIEYSRSPEDLYVYLKAYLMLGDPSHLDKEHLKQMAELEWTNPRVASPETGRAMSAHFQQLLNYSDTLRPLALDQRLIAQVRSSIQQASIPQIIYGGLKRAYADDSRKVNLVAEAGVGSDRVFKRRSGVNITEQLPAFYSKDVFEEVTTKRRAEMLKDLTEDRWVWGEGATAALDVPRITVEVTTLYEQDYLRAWDALLDDLEAVSFPTIPETVAALRLLTASTSPLRGLVRMVNTHTNLVAAPAASSSGVIDKAREKITRGIGGVMRPIQEAIGVPTTAPGAIVTAHFQPIHQLQVGEIGKQPIDAILAVIGEIEKQLGTIGPDLGGADSVKAISSETLRGLRRSLEQQAEPLPAHIAKLITDIGRISGQVVVQEGTSIIERQYAQEVLPACREAIANRYPFAMESKVDVPLADFARIFGSEGVFQRFFAKYLAEQVDTTGRAWTTRDGSASLTRAMLDQFAAAESIRDMFFPGGAPRPTVSFSVTISNVDASSSRFILQIDNRLAEGRPGRPLQTPMQWPGEPPGAAVATFEGQFIPDKAVIEAGPWAWLRVIDRNSVPPPDPLGRVTLAIRNPYHHAQVVVEAASGRANPFGSLDWRQFSCEAS